MLQGNSLAHAGYAAMLWDFDGYGATDSLAGVVAELQQTSIWRCKFC